MDVSRWKQTGGEGRGAGVREGFHFYFLKYSLNLGGMLYGLGWYCGRERRRGRRKGGVGRKNAKHPASNSAMTQRTRTRRGVHALLKRVQRGWTPAACLLDPFIHWLILVCVGIHLDSPSIGPLRSATGAGRDSEELEGGGHMSRTKYTYIYIGSCQIGVVCMNCVVW